jgi:hypothetical protein
MYGKYNEMGRLKTGHRLVFWKRPSEMAFPVFTNGRPLFQGPFSFDFPNDLQNDLGIVSEYDG